ncbi:hypothetical protein [Winogradskyella pulchriflava]|uniref:Lipocalin-like domain-containing protein n=1 Tax=Winogradskyella pulchriflava TaxID=1110688 RepID=A0ABV6Q992_9FLAO
MKLNLKLPQLFIVAIFSIVAFSCSSDDGDNDSSSIEGVPSGEIVPTELRNEALTGFFSETPIDGETQKWWTHIISNFDFSSDECGDDFSIEDQGFIAFYPDGNYYQKFSIGGNPSQLGSWEWSNSSHSRITVYTQGLEQEFTVTYLNEDNVVYGSVQSASGCSVTTYEQFNNPHYE